MPQTVNNQQIVVTTRSNVPVGYIPILIDRTSPFGNPYPIKSSGGRAASIRKYRAHLAAVIKPGSDRDPILKETLRQLVKAYVGGAKLALICHCAPKPCHGDILSKCIVWAAGEAVASMNNRASK